MSAARTAYGVGAAAALLVGTAGCATDNPDTPGPSVPTSASLTVPAGNAAKTAPGTVLSFGSTALLPASTFHPDRLAAYTVTGVRRAGKLPDSIAKGKGGTGYFVYLTVLSLDAQPMPAPDVLGVAGSVDGKQAALTVRSNSETPECVTHTPPKLMKRGESYSTCLVGLVGSGQEIRSGIYWANTTTNPELDYQAKPVVWTADGKPLPSAAPK
ncbi:hypothetical protein [Gordonia sp. X0973]|uniref:hypothetical protein n=1 Tax=Gordonia sp. X0973 TaxID=2742602 RepID=UPI00265731E0|nr:hypothetical protein [Gordonia sp. X0973]